MINKYTIYGVLSCIAFFSGFAYIKTTQKRFYEKGYNEASIQCQEEKEQIRIQIEEKRKKEVVKIKYVKVKNNSIPIDAIHNELQKKKPTECRDC